MHIRNTTYSSFCNNAKINLSNRFSMIKGLFIGLCPKKLYGKSILKTHEKFYLADASLKYCIMDFHTKSLASSPKNIVYFELKREGYKVYTDKNKTKEIDFVSIHCNEHIYIQIYLHLPEESVQEIVNFLEIKNHYPKYTITLDEFAGRNVNGIKMMHLPDCLLKDKF